MPNSPTLTYDNVEAEGCFSVVILDDPLIEGNKTFQYKIDSVPHENFTIAVGQPSVVTVTILDNDLRSKNTVHRKSCVPKTVSETAK